MKQIAPVTITFEVMGGNRISVTLGLITGWLDQGGNTRLFIHKDANIAPLNLMESFDEVDEKIVTMRNEALLFNKENARAPANIFSKAMKESLKENNEKEKA